MLMELAKILIFSVSSFLVLFIISKLLGKKQIAELDFIDYTVGISIGSIAAEMSTALDEPAWPFILAMAVFFLLDYLVSILGIKCNKLKKFLKGSPIIVIKYGKLDYRAMKKCKIDINDVVGLARAKGFFNINDIEFAIFETNGELSILPKGTKKPVTLEDINQKDAKSDFIINIIVDGTVSDFSLKEINRDKEWLFNELKIKSKKDIKKILLASYNLNTKEFFIHHR